MTGEYYDILIVAPLDEEAEAIFEIFPEKESCRVQDVLLSTVDLRNPGLSGLVLQLPQMGNQEAYDALKTALQQRRVGLVVCIGIAGSLSSDLKLGDVCYTGTVFDVHERQKAHDAPGAKGVIPTFSPEPYKTPRKVEVSLSFLRTDRRLKQQLYSAWQVQCAKRFLEAKEKEKSIRADDERFRDRPSAQNGKIACGAVSSSKKYNSLILQIDRKILAIETESGGLFRAAHECDTPAVTIRGISDFADGKKKKLEKALKGLARSLAAFNAATFFEAQLKNKYFLEFLQGRREDVVAGKTASLFKLPTSEMDLATALNTNMDAIESQLRALSPEYKLQPKGYVLPTPRLTPIRTDSAADDDETYVELQEALADHRVIVIDVPWSYPDRSLPWVLAENVSTAIIHDRQVFPLIVRGESIAPPKSGFEALSPTSDLARLSKDESAQILFIVHGLDITSRTRSAFVARELENFPNARLLAITRGQGSLVIESEFAQQLTARPYSISDVPFVAISSFVQKNFELPPVEAEVIAYRLHSTFQKFDLLAHPTYFAGIPKEMLSALLQANRRSELIQLAVDGFLAFVVTGDLTDVSLGLNTRKRFLSLLAIEIEVRKRTFSRIELVSLVEEFAAQHDFEIDSVKFVNAFLDHAILRFEGGVVEFTLPFIKYYLLAEALAKDESLAKLHFSLDELEFDFQTFELYCEIGAADSIVDLVVSRMKQDVAALRAENPSPGVMLSDELRPNLLKKFERIADIRVGLQRSIRRLQDQSSDGDAKQRLLDVAAKTTGKANKKSRVTQSDDAQKEIVRSKVARAQRGWRIGCVMLGGAAEQLLGTRKQELASYLVELGSLIVDLLARRFAKVNFAELKAEMLASSEVALLLERYKDETERQEIRTLLENLFDLIEMALLGQPFISTLNYLCEQSRHRVLATSIEKSSVRSPQEQIIQAAWLSDLDAKKGKKKLSPIISRLPQAPFLRIILASHFLYRVYWTHWQIRDREAILDAAQDTIKSLGLTLRRGQMMRMIGRESSIHEDPDVGAS